MKKYRCGFDGKEYTILFIDNPTKATDIAKALHESPIKKFGLDLETAKDYRFLEHKKAGLCPHLSSIRLLQLYDGKGTCYVFDVFKTSLAFLYELVNKTFVAHYGIFELKHLIHKGFTDLDVHCSMIMSILIDRAEKSPFEPDDEEDETASEWKGFGLDALTWKLFSIKIDKKWQKFDWNTLELPKEAILYSALDAVLTYKVAKHQGRKLIDYKMEKAYLLLKDMQHVIADMELSGMCIDVEAHNKLITKWEEEKLKLTTECAHYFGKGLNLNSTKQLGDWALNKYGVEGVSSWVKSQKTGLLSFSANALASLQHLPEIKSLSLYKKNEKLLSTYGRTLQDELHPITRRIHCNYSLGETRTGRLSSRSPNLQNLPRETSVRDIFVAESNHRFVLADFNQIELRVAGEVSGDTVIRGAYKRGDDLHNIFAGTVYGKYPSHVSKPERQIAKSANFGAIYGMGPAKFIQYVLTQTGKELQFDMAKHIIDSLWSKYSTYNKWCQNIRSRTERIGFVRTPLGRMRKLLPTEVYTKAPNTVIQGGAFEVMAVAMIGLRKKLPSNAKLVNSVHDEIIVETGDDVNDEEIGKLVEESMVDGMVFVFPDAVTNGLAKAVIGTRWGNIKAQ